MAKSAPKVYNPFSLDPLCSGRLCLEEYNGSNFIVRRPSPYYDLEYKSYDKIAFLCYPGSFEDTPSFEVFVPVSRSGNRDFILSECERQHGFYPVYVYA